jgi:hypothetical protein
MIMTIAEIFPVLYLPGWKLAIQTHLVLSLTLLPTTNKPVRNILRAYTDLKSVIHKKMLEEDEHYCL